jgi:hypothetical protein
MPAFSSTEAIPQGMQRLIGFAQPPGREPSDGVEGSSGAQLEHAGGNSYAARTALRTRKDR